VGSKGGGGDGSHQYNPSDTTTACTQGDIEDKKGGTNEKQFKDRRSWAGQRPGGGTFWRGKKFPSAGDVWWPNSRKKRK